MAAKMMAVILVFVFGGRYFDGYLALEFPAFTLLGSLLGSTLAIYSMIKDLSK